MIKIFAIVALLVQLVAGSLLLAPAVHHGPAVLTHHAAPILHAPVATSVTHVSSIPARAVAVHAPVVHHAPILSAPLVHHAAPAIVSAPLVHHAAPLVHSAPLLHAPLLSHHSTVVSSPLLIKK